MQKSILLWVQTTIIVAIFKDLFNRSITTIHNEQIINNYFKCITQKLREEIFIIGKQY